MKNDTFSPVLQDIQKASKEKIDNIMNSTDLQIIADGIKEIYKRKEDINGVEKKAETDLYNRLKAICEIVDLSCDLDKILTLERFIKFVDLISERYKYLDEFSRELEVTIIKVQSSIGTAIEKIEDIEETKMEENSPLLKPKIGTKIKEEAFEEQQNIEDSIKAIKQHNEDITESYFNCYLASFANILQSLINTTMSIIFPGYRVNFVTDIKYDNPLLNHPELLQKFTSNFGIKNTVQLIELSSQLSSDTSGRKNMEEICNNQQALATLELLMGLDTTIQGYDLS